MCPIEEPLVCPVMIGRDYHVAFIQRVCGAVADGRGQTVLLTGEAGIGKTRLLGAFEASAQEQGWRILRGNFFEPDRSVPFGGLTDLLRRYLRSLPPEELRGMDSLAELSMLVPELDLGDSASASDAVDKRRLLDAFSRFIAAASESGRTALVLEDLHWADDASLELVLHLARLAATRSMLVLLTYRSDEVHPALGTLIAGLERERLASEVSLHRLGVPEVDLMLRAMLGRTRPVRAEILREIHELTDGNPFFVEEVTRSLAEGSAEVWDSSLTGASRIPHSVDESVRRRVSVLSSNTRLVLELAAVAGRRFDFPLLLHISGLDEAALVASIRELIAAQLVVEESVEWFSFRHALTRQAIYSGLLQRERAGLHGRIKQTTAELYADSIPERYADLAYHAYQAGQWHEALTYSAQAGERAVALFSPGAAVEHFTRALDAAARLQETSLGAVHRSRGKAYETLGEFEPARRDFEAGLAIAQEEADQRAEWESILDLGMLWAGQDYSRCGEYLNQATALAQAIGDRTLLAHSLNRLGNWYSNMERPAEGIRQHEEAFAIFRELNDESGLASTLDLLGMANLIGADFARSRQYYREAMVLFEKLNDRPGMTSSLATIPVLSAPYHADAAASAPTLPEATEDGLRGLRLAREIGWRAGESFALWCLATCSGAQGELGRALDYARGGLAIARDIEHVQWQAGAHMASGAIFLDLKDFSEARRHLQESYRLATSLNSLFFTKHAAALLALTHLAAGDIDEARTLLSSELTEQRNDTLAQREVDCAWAELLLAEGNVAEALQSLDDLLAAAKRPSEGRGIPRIDLLRGKALTAMGRHEEADAAFKSALATCEIESRVSLVWSTQASQAELALARGDHQAATAYADAARESLRRLSLTVPDEVMRQRFLSIATASVPGRDAPPAIVTTASSALTAREREVASLVAKGLSNRAIAEALVLSERTVETHVANAFARLGFSSRTELAVWAAANEPGADS